MGLDLNDYYKLGSGTVGLFYFEIRHVSPKHRCVMWIYGFVDDAYFVPLTHEVQNEESHSATPWDAKSSTTGLLFPCGYELMIWHT